MERGSMSQETCLRCCTGTLVPAYESLGVREKDANAAFSVSVVLETLFELLSWLFRQKFKKERRL